MILANMKAFRNGPKIMPGQYREITFSFHSSLLALRPLGSNPSFRSSVSDPKHTTSIFGPKPTESQVQLVAEDGPVSVAYGLKEALTSWVHILPPPRFPLVISG